MKIFVKNGTVLGLLAGILLLSGFFCSIDPPGKAYSGKTSETHHTISAEEYDEVYMAFSDTVTIHFPFTPTVDIVPGSLGRHSRTGRSGLHEW
ncbi:MAG: hypothetical protein AAGN35_04265 [Bacteroidota bacterium]